MKPREIVKNSTSPTKHQLVTNQPTHEEIAHREGKSTNRKNSKIQAVRISDNRMAIMKEDGKVC